MKIKFPTGTTAENNQLVLPEGMLSVDMEKKAIRLHDGVTQGGFEVVGEQAFTPPPSLTWVKGAALGAGRDLNSVAYGGGMWVTVNEYHGVYTSPDGNTWTTVAKPSAVASNTNWYTVRYLDGMFYVGGTGSQFMTSPDGITWSTSYKEYGASVRGIAKNGTTIVAACRGGYVLTSTDDGVTWPPIKLLDQVGASYNHNDVIYQNGLFVMVTVEGKILTSPNGTDWVVQDTPDDVTILQSIYYHNGLFVTVGGTGTILTSEDAATWNKVTHTTPMAGNILHINRYKGSWIILRNTYGVRSVATSNDLHTWVECGPDDWGIRHPECFATDGNIGMIVGDVSSLSITSI